MRPRRRLLQAALLAVLAVPTVVGPLAAQGDVVAFGDSITEGPEPFDEDNRGGYPSRLQELLRAAGMSDLVVNNEGASFETTAEGLSRIDSVLQEYAQQAGLFIIMEGTNDVNRVIGGEISIESTVQNLEAMAAKVRARAIEVLYATVIPRPPWTRQDRTNAVTRNLVFRLRELTSAGNRQLAEPFEVFDNRASAIFDTHYFCCDVVGHPNAAGFELLAEIFANRIQEVDNLAPPVSFFVKTGPEDVIGRNDRLMAVVHESGSGILRSDTFFTLNGRAVPTEVEGTKRRLELSYRVTQDDVACAARITVRTEDETDPPNARNPIVAELAVEDVQHLRGDVDGDCRVDGIDLGLLGLSFGSRLGDYNYSKFADTNNDREVDGDDLARLAKNFGKDSS